MDILGELPPARRWEAMGLPDALEEYLEWLGRNGCRGLVWTPEPTAAGRLAPLLARPAPASGGSAVPQRHSEAALPRDNARSAGTGREEHSPRPAMSLLPVLPNMALYARDSMDLGPVGTILRRWRALGPLDRLRLAARALPWTPGLLRRRFASGLLLLLELEYLGLPAPQPRSVLLHGSVVDLALALGCPEALERFRAWAEGRGLKPIFLSHHLGLFAARATEWGLGPVHAATPINPAGYLMYPSQGAVEELCRKWDGRLLAIETDAGGCRTWEEARAYLESLGAASAVLPYREFKPAAPESGLEEWKRRDQALRRLVQEAS